MRTDVTQTTIWVVILGMAVLNYAVRFIPIALISRVDLPKPVARWLSLVPVSVMGALVFSEVLRPDHAWGNPLVGPHLYAAIVTGLVFHFSRSFVGASIAGITSFVLLQHLLPFLVR
jgi:branched-subunit amino acid transport protein